MSPIKLRSPHSDELAHEREVLEELLKSEGWKVYVRRCALEFKGAGFHSRIGAALKSGNTNAPAILYETSLEIERSIQWVTDRVRQLRGSVE